MALSKKRFQVPYSYCGCPLSGTSTGQRLARFQSRLGLRDVTISQDDLRPPQREDALLATHASDHNCAFKAKQYSYSIRKVRAQEISERRVRDIKHVRNGKVSEDIVNRGLSHNAAFLVPRFLHRVATSCRLPVSE